MTQFKHRWHPVTGNVKPNHYLYECQRCHKIITTLLKEKQP
jgi:hypothetical protein